MSPWRMSAALAAVIGLFAGAAAQAADVASLQLRL